MFTISAGPGPRESGTEGKELSPGPIAMLRWRVGCWARCDEVSRGPSYLPVALAGLTIWGAVTDSWEGEVVGVERAQLTPSRQDRYGGRPDGASIYLLKAAEVRVREPCDDITLTIACVRRASCRMFD